MSQAGSPAPLSTLAHQRARQTAAAVHLAVPCTAVVAGIVVVVVVVGVQSGEERR